MIETLHISNYALIDSIDITFHDGFNIITGETGAGKSIILGALSLLLGARADTKAVRDSDRKSVIEAMFSLNGYNSLETCFRENDVDWDPEQCILRREIHPNGRSRAFVNDTPVTIAQLQAIALQLVDLHSQHQNLLLASPPYQLRIIDSLARNEERLARYTELYNNFRTALRRYNHLRRELQNDRADEEYLRFQLSQLEEINLIEGEQEELERERDLLTNISEVKSALLTINNAFTDASPSIMSLLKDVDSQIRGLSDVLEDADRLTERIEALRIEAQDIADTFAEYDRDISADPSQLEDIEQRLNDIYDLQRKHKVDSVESLIEIRDNMRRQLDNVTNGDDRLRELEVAAKKAKIAALEKAREISEIRRQEAEKFAETLKDRAVPLGMKNLRCQIIVSPGEMSATGIDNVEFLFAFNKNQPLLPVGNTASGGEISRLMLSIKSIVADKMQLPSIIFDEVDTGVSGDVAHRMGEMMQQISHNIQVIAITHLPQVAAKGTSHYKVFKEDDEHSTHTRITELTGDLRVDELAMMLSGSHINEAARANARSLLNNSRQNE